MILVIFVLEWQLDGTLDIFFIFFLFFDSQIVSCKSRFCAFYLKHLQLSEIDWMDENFSCFCLQKISIDGPIPLICRREWPINAGLIICNLVQRGLLRRPTKCFQVEIMSAKLAGSITLTDAICYAIRLTNVRNHQDFIAFIVHIKRIARVR